MATASHNGAKIFGNGESWISWWLFTGQLSSEEVEAFCDANHINAYYQAPGCAFSRGANVQYSPGHTLITQSGGYDI